MLDTLYITDLDGTLLAPDGTLRREDRDALNAMIALGLPLTYVTARSFHTAHIVTEGLDLRMPVATFNGAFLVDPRTERAIESLQLSRAQLDVIEASVRRIGASPMAYAMLDGTERVSWMRDGVSPGMAHYHDTRGADPRFRPVDALADLFVGDVFYTTFIGDRGEIEALRDALGTIEGCMIHIEPDTYDVDDWWLDIRNENASKANAVHRLRALTGARRIVGFGDNLNDLGIFEASDACYAVANARAEVKAAASGVIGSNAEGGVVRWLRENAC